MGYAAAMTLIRRTLVSAAALAALIGFGFAGGPASAQGYDQDDYVPPYTTWQPAWDQYQFDRRHVILGIVTGFSPYRLTIQRRNGMVQTVDLKNGTMILPTGATPTQGERAAIVGYYSNGTFIANRVVLRT
jgi:hypothetical protein